MSHAPGHNSFDFSFQPSQGPGSTNFQGFGNNDGGAFDLGSGLSLPGNFAGQGAGLEEGGIFSRIFKGLGSEGFQSGMSTFGSMARIYTGLKALGLAKDQFKFQKEAFNRNFGASAKSFNNELKDRWTARSASAKSQGRDFQSMDQWMSGRSIDPNG